MLAEQMICFGLAEATKLEAQKKRKFVSLLLLLILMVLSFISINHDWLKVNHRAQLPLERNKRTTGEIQNKNSSSLRQRVEKSKEILKVNSRGPD